MENLLIIVFSFIFSKLLFVLEYIFLKTKIINCMLKV